MKKSLLALAAMGAFAGAAQAQSSVTVYGILDVGFQGVTDRDGATKVNSTQFTGEGSQSTSRLGFRGTEDLGGGTRAFFTAEFGLSPTEQTLSGDTRNGLFNRQTFVGLGQKGIGQFAIGTQNTPVHNAVGRTDPGQLNNISGNVIYTATGGAGSGETTTSYTVRINNALTLQTDRFAGFQANLIYNNNNSDSSASGGRQINNEAWGGGINYVWKKLNVDVAYQSLKNTNTTAGVSANPGVPASAAIGTISNPFGTAIGQTQMYAGAMYDFGILKAYAQYINSKAVANINSNQYIQRSAQQIGVRGNITKTIEGWASVGNGRLTAGGSQQFGASQATQNFTGYQVGGNYILSKRTNAYAIFGSTQVSSTSVNPSEGRSSYGIGIRHTF